MVPFALAVYVCVCASVCEITFTFVSFPISPFGSSFRMRNAFFRGDSIETVIIVFVVIGVHSRVCLSNCNPLSTGTKHGFKTPNGYGSLTNEKGTTADGIRSNVVETLRNGIARRDPRVGRHRCHDIINRRRHVDYNGNVRPA